MSLATEHITRIEEKLGTVLSRVKSLSKENERLKRELEEMSRERQELKTTKTELELQINLLKSTASEEANESRVALKKKLNDYIKEIDRCIALLGDKND